MEIQVQRITREIPHRGIAYLIFQRYPAEEQNELLLREVRALKDQGAREIYVASTDPEAPFAEGESGQVRLTHVHDILEMERALGEDRPCHGGRLQTVPLTEALEEQWLALYNEAFAAVPNAATYGQEELAEKLADPGSCGFVLEDGMPLGIYELDLRSGEIEGIGLKKAARGRGLGRELLLLAMYLLAERGHDGCRLLVSTANQAAYRLYQETGFSTRQVRSRWFRAETTGQKDRDAEEDGK
ncbi:GNAT family N-acetyltransferase [uncultured Intestinimonas sp.]|uniref:GNAT family N-acetyltransferase n=1 Tax=uncultured Intestinimonas sp. TaxID=1689265 RepID=UPI0025D88A4E|nr:GNAT family N-acetyltransferase [uncultured Intestinimonas sp.]